MKCQEKQLVLSSAKIKDSDELLSKIGVELEFLMYVLYSDAMTMTVTWEARKVNFICKK